MTVCFWNIRGFNNPQKQKRTIAKLDKLNVEVLCLLETRVRSSNADRIASMLSQNWNIFFNYDVITNGRIWIFWRKYLQFTVTDVADQNITLRGRLQNHDLVISAVYGSNDGVHRRRLWTQLKAVGATVGSLPWIIGGDFNIFLDASESSDSDVLGPYVLPEMEELKTCMDELILMDHPYAGPLFTWANNQGEGFLARKLDRILVNGAWLHHLTGSYVEFLAKGESDHCPGIAWLEKELPASRPKPFKIFNLWTSNPAYRAIVEESWQANVRGDPMIVLFLKLKRLKAKLKALNREQYGNISGKVIAKRMQLEEKQIQNLSVDGVRDLEGERALSAELHELEHAKSLFYRQKAKVQWLVDGDQGTKFFHSTVAAKRKKSTIRLLLDEEGNRLETFEQMSEEMVAFFQNLIGTEDHAVQSCSVDLLGEILNLSLPAGANELLSKDVTDLEIKEALFGQGNEKSPGPDGYTAWFFKDAWDIVREDFVNAVKFFFRTSHLLPAFNATSITLVPKLPNSCRAREFRPISCCTVVYKTITRILVSRIAPFFPEMILPNQSAFVKGRNIADNTLLAQELVKGYSQKSLSARCALKVDLQKAFDSISWDFVLKVLEAMGLSQVFVGWIRACVTSTHFSICFNGSLVGYFSGRRGVRQGDPLSPYLFVLVMNVFSGLLNLAAGNGLFRYHPKCKKIQLTHLSFADDLLIFCRGDKDSVVGVMSVLEQFYTLSGLKLNATKTEFFACGVNDGELLEIQELTGFKLGNLPVRYLGVPLVTRKLSEKDCQALLVKLKDKLSCWANRKLSYGGRLQLIRAVLFSITNYWCRQLVLPKNVIAQIEQLCMRFFWKGENASAQGARVSWLKVCQLKAEGGLGLKSIQCWNKTCLLLLVKAILAGEGSLWVAWLNAYVFKGESYWTVRYKPHFSWVVKKLLNLRDEAMDIFDGMRNLSDVNTRWIWEKVRSQGERTQWHKLVWFSLHIPRHSIITWMAILDRLPTRERLVRMGITQETSCLFCGGLESRDHIFSSCSFAIGIWETILRACGVQRQVLCWDEEIHWLATRLKGRSLVVLILKLAWNAYIYSIWEERNCKYFRNSSRSQGDVIRQIRDIVSTKLRTKCIDTDDRVNVQLCETWGIQIGV